MDADAHVVEPVSFFVELFARFPDDVGVRTDTQLGVMRRGPALPAVHRPGSGLSARQGPHRRARASTPASVEGVLANADTDGIDEMVMFPSFGLCVPTLESPVLGRGPGPPLQRVGGGVLRRERGAAPRAGRRPHRARRAWPSRS